MEGFKISIISFLKLVEIQTKAASVIPFLLGTLYAVYRFDTFNLKNFMLMLISLLCIDMATTAVNNYMDYKKAVKTQGFNYESHNAIVSYKLKEKTVLTVIFTLCIIAAALGFMLYLNTDIIVLILGGISFIVGILYSFGPVPISRTPLGEIFSGFFMGFVILFIAVYIHVSQGNLISLSYISGILSLQVNLKEVMYILLISITTMMGISNIMLANNTCDIEDDIENKRYTLPIYIGRKNALKLFKMLYYIIYADIAVLIILGVEPLICGVTLITLIPVKRNINIFYEKQTKKDTFIIAVKNFLIINSVHILALTAAVLMKSIYKQ
ncbi:1,4-dihydroxy-2-naphthoate polyprenyltransferase [Clostridium polynesiense]|uniref:1,4-dihydroxy-2-naphthoate polyprenyltransferase n=1 Tax=Clostridium polynesiense TaxID=1325933 RepID=UPI000A5E8B0D|nr:1,4-dihydroxy-2-naphthoate polyprenyltransferase [Clostridium polynesiense]